MKTLVLRRSAVLLAAAQCILSGCATPWTDYSTPIAPPASSGIGVGTAGPQAPSASNYSPQYSRVEQIGRRVLEANSDMGLGCTFCVPETPQPEVFHDGQFRVFVSEALVNQCQTDGQLAAVLSMELAKMACEQDTQRQVWDANGDVVGRSAPADSEPPPEVRIGRDGGSFGDADPFRKAELAKLGYDRRSPAAAIKSRDPYPVARQLLARAGFSETELDAAGPLLRSAAKNNSVEKQIVRSR